MATVGGAKRKTFRASFWANVRAHPALHGRVEAADAVENTILTALPLCLQELNHWNTGYNMITGTCGGGNFFLGLGAYKARLAPHRLVQRPAAFAPAAQALAAIAVCQRLQRQTDIPAPAATDRHSSACSDGPRTPVGL